MNFRDRCFRKHQRQTYIRALMNDGAKFDHETIHGLSAKFGVGAIVIESDVGTLTYHPEEPLPWEEPRRLTSLLQERAPVLARDGNVCQYCGKTVGKVHIDHVIPVKRGGNHDPCNLTVSCISCNLGKGKAVWIPLNLEAITKGRPEWLKKVLSMADTNDQLWFAQSKALEKTKKSVALL